MYANMLAHDLRFLFRLVSFISVSLCFTGIRLISFALAYASFLFLFLIFYNTTNSDCFVMVASLFCVCVFFALFLFDFGTEKEFTYFFGVQL